MKLNTKLRIISGTMFVVAVIFVLCAIACPTMGQVIWIGNFEFGPKQWRVCYLIYAIIMVALFALSFLDRKER